MVASRFNRGPRPGPTEAGVEQGEGAVLTAIDPILTGVLLAHLDAMGHSVRTGETRTYGNVIVRKGVVAPDAGEL